MFFLNIKLFFVNVEQFLKHFFQLLKFKFVKNFQLLLLDFDPVKNVSYNPKFTKEQLLNSKLRKLQFPLENASTTNKINIIYLFPMTSMLAIIIESLYINLQASYQQKPEVLNTLLARRIFPPSTWAQADLIIHIALLMSTLIYICLLFDRNLNNNKFTMYLFKTGNTEVDIVQNCQLLNKNTSSLIARSWSNVNRIIRWIIFIVFIQLVTFFLNSFFLTWSTNLGQNSLKFIEMIIFTAYLPLSNLYMILFFLLSIRYIRIKQNYLQDKVTQLEKNVIVSNQTSSQKEKENYRHWKVLNVNVATIYEEIQNQNYFWSKYLTIYFGVYIMEVL